MLLMFMVSSCLFGRSGAMGTVMIYSGKPHRRGRLSTADLFIEIDCFAKKKMVSV